MHLSLTSTMNGTRALHKGGSFEIGVKRDLEGYQTGNAPPRVQPRGLPRTVQRHLRQKQQHKSEKRSTFFHQRTTRFKAQRLNRHSSHSFDKSHQSWRWRCALHETFPCSRSPRQVLSTPTRLALAALAWFHRCSSLALHSFPTTPFIPSSGTWNKLGVKDL